MSESKKEFNLDDFLEDAAKVVNPIQANADLPMDELLSYTEEEIKEMDAERDKAIALEKQLSKMKTEIELPEPPKPKGVDADILAEVESVIDDYGDKDDLDCVKMRMFCYFADFQRPLLEPLLSRSSRFLTQLEEVTTYQLAVDSKMIYLLEDILKTLKRK